MEKINLASENYAPVHPDIMSALLQANTGNMASYGNDEVTKDAINTFKTIFGDDIEVYFTFNGTGANNFGLSCMVEKHHSIFCTDVAHLLVDESNAPETFTGCRLFPVKSAAGKMLAADLKTRLSRIGDVHHPQAKVVSLTQPTEYGTVYTLNELKEIKAICTEHDMLLHVDGARFYNAADFLGLSLGQLSREAGIDVLTLGGTKTGLMYGEAVIFFSPKKDNPYQYNLKRSMQLASKNRFIAVQFKRLLQGDLWQNMASYTNSLAVLFKQEAANFQAIKIAYPVETNAVFLTMSLMAHEKTQAYSNFYYWNEDRSEARLIFSFNNTADQVRDFVAKLAESLAE